MNQTLALPSPSIPARMVGKTYLCVSDLYDECLRQGELIAGQCLECSHRSFPPRPCCSECQSSRIRPIALSGRGRLCSAEVAEHADELSVGSILLEEGIQVRALLVGAFSDPDVLQACLAQKPVEVAPSVLTVHGLTILAFEPA